MAKKILFSKLVAPKAPRNNFNHFYQNLDRTVNKNLLKSCFKRVCAFLPQNMINFHALGAEDTKNVKKGAFLAAFLEFCHFSTLSEKEFPIFHGRAYTRSKNLSDINQSYFGLFE